MEVVGALLALPIVLLVALALMCAPGALKLGILRVFDRSGHKGRTMYPPR